MRFHGHLHCTSSCPQVAFCAWQSLLMGGLRPLPEDSLCALWLPASLLWPSLRPRVCESSSLSLWFFPFRGPTPISRLFLSLGPRRSRSPFPSLAPSWWNPCPLMRWALLTLSGYVLSVLSAFSLHRSRLSIPFAMSPLSRSVFADGIRHFASGSSCGGASPHALGSVGALGVSGGSTYIALHRTCSVSSILPYAHWSSGRCFILFLRDVPHVFMPINLSVSLTYSCPSLSSPIGF